MAMHLPNLLPCQGKKAIHVLHSPLKRLSWWVQQAPKKGTLPVTELQDLMMDSGIVSLLHIHIEIFWKGGPETSHDT